MTIRPLERRTIAVLSGQAELASLRAFAIMCFALFAGSVLLMPAITQGYDPVTQTISEGVLLPYGYIQTGGLALLAVGSFALAAALWRCCASRWNYGTAALMACSAAFVVLLTVFPTDYSGHAHSSIGRLHNFAAVSAFIAATAAMTCSSLPLRRPIAWSNVVTVAFPVAMLVFAVCLTVDIGPRGLVQRTSAAFQLVWLVALAMRADAAEESMLRSPSA